MLTSHYQRNSDMKYSSLLFILLLLTPLSACAESGEVNIYSARKEKLIKPLLDQFSEQTGIKVNLVTGKAAGLLTRLESEGKNSPADLFITIDAGRLYRAKEAGVLQAVDSRVLKQTVPENLRDSESHWFGLSQRARPIFYVKNKVSPDQLSSYEALSDEKWKGRICIRSSNNIYNQSLVASMSAHRGQADTEAWIKRFVANFARPPKGGDRDQIKAAAAGICDIAIANTYYVANMLNSKDEKQVQAAKAVAIFWPNQANRGTHVNISGIGMTASAKNKDNAIKLMEFLLSDTSQKWYAEVNQEYPVKVDIPTSETLKSWGEFKADTLALEKLGELNADAVKMMDRAGWK